MNKFMILAIVLVVIAISIGGYMYYTAEQNSIEKKYPYWGWGKHAGLRCKNNDNTGCNTMYDQNGQLVEIKE